MLQKIFSLILSIILLSSCEKKPLSFPLEVIIESPISETGKYPNSFINIFKFEIKGKERRYQLAETGTLSKTETNNLSSVEYNAKKYGKNSYLIIMNNLTPGEYGIVFGDPNNANTKNEMKVTTFTVKQADFLKKD